MDKRYELINYYITTRKFKSFLEIGTDKGEAFNAINVDKKVSVDPNRSTNATHYMTSDEYFAQTDDKFDIIFIDGLHEYSQVDRDIKNALKHLNDHGVIIMHDCHPNSEACQRHCSHYPGGEWTGDCWKAYVKNRAELQYEMFVWDHDWGCGVIDTDVIKQTDTSDLPIDMSKMTYADFVAHPEWMNFKDTI